jgi:fructokinase
MGKGFLNMKQVIKSSPATTPLTFVGIGEVLFDVFEDGTETLGGAPLNFVVHVHQLAAQLGVGYGIIASSINFDPRGDKIIDSLRRRRMSTRYIARSLDHPTGLVSVFMQSGEPGYQIEPEAAWDYINDSPEIKELAGQCSAICFGSLAQRCKVSRETIRNFLETTPPQTIRLYDVNLRKNTLTGETGYSSEIVDYSCQTATIIKANQSELIRVLDLLRIGCPDVQTLDGIRHGMELLMTRFPDKAIVVTRGSEGTIVLNRDGEFDVTAPIPIEGKPHPVGAGDACSAGIGTSRHDGTCKPNGS